MIFNRPLTASERKLSQRNLLWANAINGFSYMCLGETVLILFAVKLQCPDQWTALLGGMVYFGFVMLPLGKVLSARYGAVRCQADCWVYRNLAAMLVAAAAPLTLYVSARIGLAFLFIGAFLFYGFRAAALVLIQPLMGEICTKDDRGLLIGRALILFYTSNVVALLLISGALKLSSSIWMLFAIIVAGTLAGLACSGFQRRMLESGDICTFARRPLLPMLPELWRDRTVRRQVIAGMADNLGAILTVPMSMLALKRSCGISDTHALIYFLLQLGAAIAASKLLEKYADQLGGRKLTLYGFYCYFGIAVFWLLVPEPAALVWLGLPFLLCGCGCIGANNATQVYFLNTVPAKIQVQSSILISVATGVISGLCGMVLSSGLLSLAAHLAPDSVPQTYRLYFLFVLLVMPVLAVLIHRLPDVEKPAA